MDLEKARRLVAQFEAGTLPKEQWTHTAHFIMALWYCVQYPLPRAVQKIRQGIQAYNVSIGGVNSDTSGYHETITLFYTNLIAGYLVTASITELTDEAINTFLQQPFLEKHYVFGFYSNEVLLSKQARRHWVPPTLESSTEPVTHLITEPAPRPASLEPARIPHGNIKPGHFRIENEQ